MADTNRLRRSERGRRLLGFALSTFHVLVLVWVFVFRGYRTGRLGEGLDDIGTGLGLLIFAIAWIGVGAVGWIALGGLSRGTSSPTVDVLMRAVTVGGIAGVIVVVPVALLAAVTVPLAGLLLGVIGVAVAALVGGLLALAFAAVDIGLLAFATLLDRKSRA
jgi:hypothetical protein